MSSRDRILTFALLLLPAISLAAQPTILPLDTGAQGADARVEVKAQSPGGLTLELSLPGLLHEQVDRDGMTFDRLDIIGGGAAGQVGQAGLPTYTRLVALPAGSGVQVRVLSSDLRALGTMTIDPRQPIVGQDKAAPAFDLGLYQSAAASEPTAIVGEPAIMAGLRVVPVTFQPVGYDPRTGEVTVASRMTVDVQFSGSDGRNDKAFAPRMISESFATIFEEEILGFQRDASVATGPGTYIMICPNNATVLNIVEPLADWRRRQGYTVQVVTTATTGTTTTSIKSWLTTQYTSANPPLEYVTLVGDANGSVTIPTYRETYSGYNGEGDHQYTTLDGGDVLSDVHLGRLSVTSTSQLATVVDKILDYETAPDMSDTSWFTTAGLTGDPASSGMSCIFVNQFVKQQLLDMGYTRIDTIWSSPFLNQMLATVNQGESLFTYRGYIGMSGMSSGHIESMSNGRQLPFAAILTCATGSFWSDTTARSEAFLRAANGGGIASIGTATSGTHTRYNNCIFMGMNNGLLNSADHLAGPALTRGKMTLYNNYWENEWQNVWVWSTWNNLMGDPATSVFTGVPDMLEVDYPSQVSLGANALAIRVTRGGAAVPGARVAVYQDGTVSDFAYSDINGDALLDIASATNGDVLVTVTGTNLHPHLGQTAVGAVTRSLDFESLNVVEISGNGNGEPNPGETLDLQVTLRNAGTSAVSGAVGELLSNVAGISVLDPDASYGTVAAGGTATGTFRVLAESDAPGGSVNELRLDATGSASSWTSIVAVPVHGPWGNFNRMTFGGPGGNLDPGESGSVTFDLANAGDRATAGVTATLSCNSQWITVTDGDGGWGALGVGAASTQSDPFAISISSDCYPGHIAGLVVTLNYAEGGMQVIEFPVIVGTAAVGDPTGPDAYGYYAFDNADPLPEAPAYQWVELVGVGTNTGISDNSRHDDETRSFDLPFPFVYYGQTYDRVSICSNGWLSFGDTYIKLYRNWTMPADGSPNAMICAFWDDLAGGSVYQWYDSANHRYIVQWDAFGSYNGGNYSGNCTFQIILHDPAHYATDTGDGPITMQYQAVTVYADETTYFTTGIQNEARDTGVTYVYGNNYPASSASVQANRAIKFVPVVPQTQGILGGAVTNASGGGSAIEGATVAVLGAGRQFTTDALGDYSGGVPEGVYDVAVWHESFAPDTTYNVVISETTAATVNFALDDVRGPSITNVTNLPDTENTAGPYAVQANITDLTGVDSYALHYTSSASGGPYTLAMTVIDGGTGLVEAQIPGQPSGTRVQYWLTAADVVANTSAAPVGAPWPSYGFLVSIVDVIASDDCESATGWTGNPDGTDDATTGHWEHGDPIGTTYNGPQVQTEDDHTPAPGVNCWFTGQHTEGQSAGFNDVDGGETTLTSAIYNAAGYDHVEVSYWRWYTNDLGFNAGESDWIAQVSNDGGGSWVDVENTSASDNSWQEVSFMLTDYFATPGQVRLRFLANDYGNNSLVEAAVDDVLISSSVSVSDVDPPTVTVTAPGAGSSFTNGESMNIAWNAADDVGVVHAQVWLSLDGGANYDMMLAEGALNDAASWWVNVPNGPPAYDARIRVDVFDGMERTSSDVSDAFTIVPGTTDTPQIAGALVLAQNHPNPFNPQTVITFSLPRAQDATLRIYDISGRLVRSLVQGAQTAGMHEVTWKGRDDSGSSVASGMYFFRLVTEEGSLVRKMTLLK